ncbi:hypothetical protein ACFLQY_02570 [Verrucomicrobiota bacterium]
MSEIKSAWELAMERFGGDEAPLTDEQKSAIAEIESKSRAKLAETEIMMSQKIAAARAAGDATQLALLEEALRREAAQIREDAEARKEAVRNG